MKYKFQPKRLLKLADLLKKDAKNEKGIKFDMGTWGDVRYEKDPLSCGTQACAMGLAALSGAFKRAGLGYRIEYGEVKFTWNGRRVGAMYSAKKLFGLDDGEVGRLFLPSGGHERGAFGELRKAKQIRDFVKEKQKESGK